VSASSIATKQGRTRVPGVYSETIPVGVPLSSPGAKGLLLIGTAEGGEPGTIHTLTRPGQARELFRSGNLLDAALLAFDPSRSAKIPGRPAHVHCYKTNPALQGAAVLGNGDGDAITITSLDYGAFTARIGIDIGLGATKGLSAVVTLDDTVESGDDIGGDGAFTGRYDPAGEASGMILTASATGLAATYTLPLTGSPIVDILPVPATLKVSSTQAYDNYQRVTLYGINALDTPISEVVDLNGVADATAAVPLTFKALTAVRVDGAFLGNIVVETAVALVLITMVGTMVAGITGAFNVISSAAADVGMSVLVTGKSAAGNTITQVFALNGTTKVSETLVFAKFVSARVIGTTTGQVDIRQESDDAVGASIAAGVDGTAGINEAGGLYQPSKLAFDSVIAGILAAPQPGAFVVIRGLNQAGAPVVEYFAVSDASADTTNDWTEITQVELGALDVATTLTLTGTAAQSLITARPLLRDAVSFFNALPGFEATLLEDASFLVADLDSAAKEINAAVAVSFVADLAALVNWLNLASELVSAAKVALATGPPSPTLSRVYLTGGTEGTADISHFNAALLAGRALSVEPSFESSRLIIVPLDTSDAVRSALNGHLRLMDGRHERAAYVGLASTIDKAAIKAAIRAVNNRQMGVFAQGPKVYDVDGAEVTLDPWGWAVLAAAMQAGSPVATPLTEAEGNAISSSGDASWDPVDDVEEMIAAGLIVVQGRKIVRSVSTWLEDDNPFYTEMSTNESLDDSAFNMRRALRPKIGNRNFDGAASTVKTMAIVELQRQVTEGEIKSFNVDSVVAEDTGDGFNVDYEMEPIEPINCIRIRAYAQRLSVRV